MINHGCNPAVTVPDQRKIVEALRSLELLVSIDPFMTPTARLSHYILPPKLSYERADLPIFIFEPYLFPKPYTRYTPALVPPPEEAEVCDVHYVFWSLAKRLGTSLAFMGTPLVMDRQPSADEMPAVVAGGAPLHLDVLRNQPLGTFFDPGPQTALLHDPPTAGHFVVPALAARRGICELSGQIPAGPRGR